MKQFYTSDEAVMVAEATKVKKRRPNMPNVAASTYHSSSYFRSKI
jgi:hypothetical protein